MGVQCLIFFRDRMSSRLQSERLVVVVSLCISVKNSEVVSETCLMC